MTVQEFEETIFRLLRAEPFESFDVELVTGEVLQVEQPEWVATTGNCASFWTGDGPLISFDPRNTRRFASRMPTPA
jgi:hypothetical protein